jgi:hypothetical protein
MRSLKPMAIILYCFVLFEGSVGLVFRSGANGGIVLGIDSSGAKGLFFALIFILILIVLFPTNILLAVFADASKRPLFQRALVLSAKAMAIAIILIFLRGAFDAVCEVTSVCGLTLYVFIVICWTILPVGAVISHFRTVSVAPGESSTE